MKELAMHVYDLMENSTAANAKDVKLTIVDSLKDNDFHFTIEDNGKGFDVNIIKQSEGEHIGIRNVEERLRKMCGGKLSIDSKEGIGTKISIIIPK